jgi:hypothetical protein
MRDEPYPIPNAKTFSKKSRIEDLHRRDDDEQSLAAQG